MKKTTNKQTHKNSDARGFAVLPGFTLASVCFSIAFPLVLNSSFAFGQNNNFDQENNINNSFNNDENGNLFDNENDSGLDDFEDPENNVNNNGSLLNNSANGNGSENSNTGSLNNNSNLFGGNDTAFGDDPFANNSELSSNSGGLDNGFGLNSGTENLFENSGSNDILDFNDIPEPENNQLQNTNPALGGNVAEFPLAEEPPTNDLFAEDALAVDPLADGPLAEDPLADDPLAEEDAFAESNNFSDPTIPAETNVDPLAASDNAANGLYENNSNNQVDFFATEETSLNSGELPFENSQNYDNNLFSDPLADSGSEQNEFAPEEEGLPLGEFAETTFDEAAPEVEAEPRINGLTATELEDARVSIENLPNLKPGQFPEEYIIQPGDTLWDISDQLLNDPFWWPKLWSFNPSIENPHVLTPGMKIMFEPSNGVLPPSLAFGDNGELLPVGFEPSSIIGTESAIVKSWKDLDGTEILPSEIKEFDLVDHYGAKAISYRSYIPVPGYISNSSPDSQSEVSALNTQGLVNGPGTVIYSEVESGWNLEAGDKFVTMRPFEAEPDSLGDEHFSTVWAYTGVIGVIETESNGRTRFLVESTESGVRAGDLIVPFSDTLRPVDLRTSGEVVNVEASVRAIGQGEQIFAGLLDVVHLVPAQALEPGDLVPLYSHPGGSVSFDEDLQFAPSGLARVIDVKGESAAAVVVKVEREIFLGSSTTQNRL